MIKRLLRNYRIKNGLAIGFVLLVLVSSAVNSYINYINNKEILYKNIDRQLISAALNTELVLGEEFFDRAINKDSISQKEDMSNILKLGKLAKNEGVEYVYSMVERDNKIYFTSSSAKDDEIGTSDMTSYFDLYDEATPLLKNVLKIDKISYEESTDKWGTFRSVFIPKKTKRGNRYILGADIKIDFIRNKLNQFVKNIVITQFIIIMILMILGFLFIRISRRELSQIKAIKEELDKEIEEKTQKLKDLNDSLEQKICEEVEKNRKKDKQLLQQNRLAQMGEMISMIAHQWRQPLSAISSASNAIVLKAGLNKLDNETAIDLANHITDYSKHLSSTIDDFREFFKPNKYKSVVTYREIVDSVLSIVGKSLESKEIELEINLDSLEEFETYSNELKQVLLNLIKNAEDALIEKGIKNPKITIEAHKRVLVVKDNAGGIRNDIVDKIFDPYFSTKTKKDGTGIGLYMSKIIVEKHCKGKLSVENDEFGAVFKIEL